jgi:hypothetical protein
LKKVPWKIEKLHQSLSIEEGYDFQEFVRNPRCEGKKNEP